MVSTQPVWTFIGGSGWNKNLWNHQLVIHPPKIFFQRPPVLPYSSEPHPRDVRNFYDHIRIAKVLDLVPTGISQDFPVSFFFKWENNKHQVKGGYRKSFPFFSLVWYKLLFCETNDFQQCKSGLGTIRFESGVRSCILAHNSQVNLLGWFQEKPRASKSWLILKGNRLSCHILAVDFLDPHNPSHLNRLQQGDPKTQLNNSYAANRLKISYVKQNKCPSGNPR